MGTKTLVMRISLRKVRSYRVVYVLFVSLLFLIGWVFPSNAGAMISEKQLQEILKDGRIEQSEIKMILRSSNANDLAHFYAYSKNVQVAKTKLIGAGLAIGCEAIGVALAVPGTGSVACNQLFASIAAAEADENVLQAFVTSGVQAALLGQAGNALGSWIAMGDWVPIVGPVLGFFVASGESLYQEFGESPYPAKEEAPRVLRRMVQTYFPLLTAARMLDGCISYPEKCDPALERQSEVQAFRAAHRAVVSKVALIQDWWFQNREEIAKTCKRWSPSENAEGEGKVKEVICDCKVVPSDCDKTARAKGLCELVCGDEWSRERLEELKSLPEVVVK